MEEDLFKRFYDERLGVSFFYNSLLTRVQYSLSTTYNENDDLQLKYDEMKFRIIKLSSKANADIGQTSRLSTFLHRFHFRQIF